MASVTLLNLRRHHRQQPFIRLNQHHLSRTDHHTMPSFQQSNLHNPTPTGQTPAQQRQEDQGQQLVRTGTGEPTHTPGPNPAKEDFHQNAAPQPVGKHALLRAARAFWLEWLRPFLLILTVLLTFRSVIADWNHVPSGSMRPNILEGDRIFVNKIAYDLRIPFTTRRIAQWSNPARGDVVVFLSPNDGKRLVKRVVGLPGDRIELRRQRLWINGRRANYQRLDASTIRYLNEPERHGNSIARESLVGDDAHTIMTKSWRSTRSSFSPLTLGRNQFFVMGDNRDDSADSRVFGTLDRHFILGKATGIAMSVDPSNRFRPRWDRFFKGL